MDSGAILLVVMALVCAVLLVGVGLVTFRRFAGGSGVQECTVRCGFRGAPEGGVGGAWQRGELRFDYSRLSLHAAGRGGAEIAHWQRPAVELGQAWPLGAGDGEALGLPTGSIACALSTAYELAMDPLNYTALRSWHEAAPPGWNANVA